MFAKDRALAEGLSTYTAHIGLLTSVDSLMLKEMGAPTKALPTLDAYEGPVPIRNCLVLTECHLSLRALGLTLASRAWT